MIFKPLDASIPIHDLPTDVFGDQGEFKLWLCVHAPYEQKLNISRTWVLFEEDEIVGFLNHKLGTYSDEVDGALLINRRVVLKKFQKLGHDKTLLLKCLQDARELLELTAFDGVLCDAADNTLATYIHVGFVHIFGSKFLLTSDKIEEAIQKLSSLIKN